MPQPDFAQTLSKDRHFLQSAFKNPNKYGGLSKVEEKYRKSHEIFLKRLAALPKPEFDNTLPVHEKLDEIKKAIAENQVTIICGETGSGKTTLLRTLNALDRADAGVRVPEIRWQPTPTLDPSPQGGGLSLQSPTLSIAAPTACSFSSSRS